MNELLYLYMTGNPTNIRTPMFVAISILIFRLSDYDMTSHCHYFLKWHHVHVSSKLYLCYILFGLATETRISSDGMWLSDEYESA